MLLSGLLEPLSLAIRPCGSTDERLDMRHKLGIRRSLIVRSRSLAEGKMCPTILFGKFASSFFGNGGSSPGQWRGRSQYESLYALKAWKALFRFAEAKIPVENPVGYI